MDTGLSQGRLIPKIDGEATSAPAAAAASGSVGFRKRLLDGRPGRR